MSFRVHTACRINQFIEDPRFNLNGKSLLEAKDLLVIQNRNMAEWLKLELARSRGISAGLDYLFPEQAVRRLMEEFPHPFQDRTILFMDNLKVVLYDELQKVLFEKNPQFAPIHSYLEDPAAMEKSESGNQELRLYQLADQLGGLFYHYGMNSPDLAQAWEEGRLLESSDPQIRHHQPWQMALWKRLFGPQSSYVHLSQILQFILKEELPFQGDYPGIKLFGSSFLGETGIRFFHYLSRFVPVDYYYALPSQIFSPRHEGEKPREEWESWSALAQGISGLLRELDLTLGRDYPAPDFLTTRLTRVQQALWCNQPFENPEKEDSSLSIYSAVSPRRQVEVLKGQILQMLDQDPELRLSDIGIMAPDISLFAPYLEGILQKDSGNNDALPCHFIDLARQGDAAYTEGFLKLLDLCGSRFSRSELFSLFQNPCFAQAQGLTERRYDQWLELCENLNIRWGFSGEQRREIGLKSPETNSWDWAFKRLLLGMVYDQESDHPLGPWVQSSESEWSDQGRLIHLVRSLYGDFASLNEMKLSLEQWVVIIEERMERYLKPRKDWPQDQLDRLAIKAVFRNMNNLIKGLQWDSLEQEKGFSWVFFSQLLRELITKTGRKKGHYLTQGISCSSLKPLRGIPFKVIALLGMDYGAFPGRETSWSFDLKELATPSVDLSRRSSEGFSFLETIMSAGERLMVFFQGRNPVSGEEMLPSPVVSELMEFAGLEDSHLIHIPLHPYHDSHFEKDTSIPSYDLDHWAMAKGTDQVTVIEPVSDALDETEIEVLDLSELLRFLKNPVEHFCKRSLGIYLETEETPLEELDQESFQLEFLEERGFFKAMEEQILQGQDCSPKAWLGIQQIRGTLSGLSWDGPAKDAFLDRASQMMDQALEYRQTLQDWRPSHYSWQQGIEEPEYREDRFFYPPLRLQLQDRTVELTGHFSGFRREDRFQKLQFLYSGKYRSRYAMEGFLNFLYLNAQQEYSLDLSFMGEGFHLEKKHWSHEPRTSITLLTRLVELYQRNLRKPMALYPDLIQEALGKLDSVPPRDWGNRFQETCNQLLQQQNRSAFDMDRCIYRPLIFPQGPVFDDADLDLVKEFYPFLSDPKEDS